MDRDERIEKLLRSLADPDHKLTPRETEFLEILKEYYAQRIKIISLMQEVHEYVTRRTQWDSKTDRKHPKHIQSE